MWGRGKLKCRCTIEDITLAHLFGLVCLLLSLPFLPQQLQLLMQSNYSQTSSETGTDRLLRAPRPGELTPLWLMPLDTATVHCSPRAICWSPGAKVPVHQHSCTVLFFRGVFTFIWAKLQQFFTSAFLHLSEALLHGRLALQFLRGLSNHCVLHFISLMCSEIYKGVQRHINQHAKKEYSWYMCYRIR